MYRFCVLQPVLTYDLKLREKGLLGTLECRSLDINVE